jgi:hypothetical protein
VREINNMTWNYRVVHRVANGEDLYAIHEAYYEDDKPTSLTEEAVNPQGETLDELKDDFVYYLRALEEPVLEFSDFDKSPR